ncbi:MAG TPA: PQQ-dependent dehydrogenase, methanol/ethanol family [Steroidobacteraceae bacterium]|jgi:PQQ-dependent dehydrogenase (methanol/ethanol family)|nr:PQQ-dependent dehydrogenase, methanol/ethanol family [Steroidobacteraceae bacterium]
MMIRRSRALGTSWLLSVALLAAGAVSLTAAADERAANVTAKRLVKAADEPGQWMTYGGTYSEQRFSTLKQIDSSNIGTLGLKWYGDYATNQDQHGSPLYIDGVIYVSTSRDVVQAFDAKSGKPLWTYNPSIHGERLRYNVGLVNRGIAAWNGKIIIGTLDARLVAIDAKTGKEVWSVDTVPDSLGLGEMGKHYAITMAPRVAKGKVFIGASGGEFGVRGWIAAFDADTGKEVWRFWTVPGDPAKGFENKALAKAAKTWTGQWWKGTGGGGTVWDAAVYDPVTDLLYFGTGNASPWNDRTREPTLGDDLYSASIVAVKPDTGEYVWHYQETPGDAWDYDAVSPMMTADLTIGGKKTHVILQPSKNGFFYVLEAKTGKLISADPFTEENWATGVDLKTGRPKVVPAARYEKAPWDLAPGVQGGHSWHPNAYSPLTGLIYIPAWEAYFTMASPPAGAAPPGGGFSLGVAMGTRVDPSKLQPYARSGVKGRLEAWDPIARKVVWETDSFANGRPTSGVLATAGNLVFMGDGGGKILSAYDAKNGTKLWSFDATTAVFAAPISYELDGVQYIAASVGGAGQGGYFAPTNARMLVFALGGKAVLPEPQAYTPPPLNPPPATGSAEVIAHGGAVYTQFCSVCHGANGFQARTSFPNLTVTPLLWTQEGFDQVVRQGGRADKGMGNFGKDLTPEDAVAVREYLISRANAIKAGGPGAAGGPGGRARPAPAPPQTGHAN